MRVRDDQKEADAAFRRAMADSLRQQGRSLDALADAIGQGAVRPWVCVSIATNLMPAIQQAITQAGGLVSAVSPRRRSTSHAAPARAANGGAEGEPVT